jgi:hypothetical protein
MSAFGGKAKYAYAGRPADQKARPLAESQQGESSQPWPPIGSLALAGSWTGREAKRTSGLLIGSPDFVGKMLANVRLDISGNSPLRPEGAVSVVVQANSLPCLRSTERG